MDINRRDFMRTAALSGAGVLLANRIMAQEVKSPNDTINVALLGAGVQGFGCLAESVRKIPGVQFTAVCDIWPYKLETAEKKMRRVFRMPVNTYSDYREMLEKEKELDAVIVATPDFWHARHTIACLEAGKHVYCEKEMSKDLPECAEMVKAAEKTGKLLQIGHQRRSNPYYTYTMDMIHKEKVCGRLTHCYGQWNKGTNQAWIPVPDKENMQIPADVLKANGFDSMEHFVNWRWFKKYSGGPICDLGSHQIDIFSWFLKSDPSQVLALGGADFAFEQGSKREWFHDVLCLYDYPTNFDGVKGSARAFYQIIHTNGAGAYFERFSGNGGSINLSEFPKKCYYLPETGKQVPAWMEQVERVEKEVGFVVPLTEAISKMSDDAAEALKVFGELYRPHQAHLQNFFNAVRANDPKILTCPADEAYKTAVAVLKVVPAIEAGGGVNFKPEDFHA